MKKLELFAGYLPGLRREEVHHKTLRFDDERLSVVVHVPLLTPEQAHALVQRVKTASAQHLKPKTVSEMVVIIDRVIAQLLDIHHPVRQLAQEVLPTVTGFDAEMLRVGLTRYLQTFRAMQLQRFVVEDFDNPKILDEFQPRVSGGWLKAFGPEALVHVWAGNVAGLSLWSLISGLLVKAANIGKVASAEPLFAGWFAQLLVETAPELADCLAVVWWPGAEHEHASPFLAQADVVLAYGSNASIAQVQALVPASVRFLPHGHKLSFALVGQEALDMRHAPDTARKVAQDVARFDQQGCYSPHVVYVQRGAKVTPLGFAHYLCAELAAVQQHMPRSRLTLEENQTQAQWLQALEMQAMQDNSIQILGQAQDPWRVVYRDAPCVLQPSALNRCIQVVAIEALSDVLPCVSPMRSLLQTVGLALQPEALLEIADQLGQVGVTRLCAVGEMTSPQAGWHHDGRFSLLDLVRMVELEGSAEPLAEQYAKYRV